MKRSKPHFHKQETRYSCIPACLRMVLSSFGTEATEDELRLLCDSTDSGTDALKAVDAARQLGFPGTVKHNLFPDELNAIVEDDGYPIVLVNLFPFTGRSDPHALVMLEMNDDTVTVLDPMVGKRVLSTDKFSVAWRLQRNLTILVLR